MPSDTDPVALEAALRLYRPLWEAWPLPKLSEQTVELVLIAYRRIVSQNLPHAEAQRAFLDEEPKVG